MSGPTGTGDSPDRHDETLAPRRRSPIGQPFFVVGAGRSGSTYLYSLLSRHPRIALTNEGHVADFLSFCVRYAAVPAYEPIELEYFERVRLRGMIPARYAARFSRVLRDHAIEALEDFYRREFADRPFTHWGDKLPSPNSVPELQSVYPDAKFVALMRDPRDGWASLRSYRARNPAELNPEVHHMTAHDWARDWRAIYGEAKHHLHALHVVRYEDLLQDPQGILADLLGFLGLDGAEQLLAGRRSDEGFAGHGTTVHPAASIGRWRSDLPVEEITTIEQVCGDFMAECGYPCD